MKWIYFRTFLVGFVKVFFMLSYLCFLTSTCLNKVWHNISLCNKQQYFHTFTFNIRQFCYIFNAKIFFSIFTGDYSYRDLFIWALLMNHRELANEFWKLDSNNICT